MRCLNVAIGLTVNVTKSAVAGVFGRKFLGYAFWVAPGGAIKRKVAAKPQTAPRPAAKPAAKPAAAGTDPYQAGRRIWPD